MRFDTNPPPLYCGIDWHARSMYVGLLSHEGDIVLHRHMQAAPAPFLKAVAPYRDGLVVAVECLVTWDLARGPLCSRRHPLGPGSCPGYASPPRR